MVDIFVSYTSSDREWAFWIGHELEVLGHKPRIHDWEISGGGDIMAWMVERHDTAAHVMFVISERYLQAPYSSLERNAAQWAATTDRPNFALPVFIEKCRAPTLLATIKRCDLYGIAEETARARLKAFLAPAARPPRGLFPGRAKRSPTSPSQSSLPRFPGLATTLAKPDDGGKQDLEEAVGAGPGASPAATVRPANDGTRGHDTKGRSMRADPINAQSEPARSWEKTGEQFLAGLGSMARHEETREADPEREQRERWKAERTAKLEAEIRNLLKSSVALMSKLEEHRPQGTDLGSPAPSTADDRARRIFDLLMSTSSFKDALDWLLRAHDDLGIADGAAKTTLTEISKRLIPWLYIASHPEQFTTMVPTHLGDILPLPLGRHSFAELVAAGLEARAADFVGTAGTRQRRGSRSVSDPPIEGPDADIEDKIRRKLLTELEGLLEYANASPTEQDGAINARLRYFQRGREPKRYYFTFFSSDYDKTLLTRIASRYTPLAIIRLSTDWRDIHRDWSFIISDLLGHTI